MAERLDFTYTGALTVRGLGNTRNGPPTDEIRKLAATAYAALSGNNKGHMKMDGKYYFNSLTIRVTVTDGIDKSYCSEHPVHHVRIEDGNLFICADVDEAAVEAIYPQDTWHCLRAVHVDAEVTETQKA